MFPPYFNPDREHPQMATVEQQTTQVQQEFKPPVVSPIKGKMIKPIERPFPRMISFVDHAAAVGGMKQQDNVSVMNIPTQDMVPTHDHLDGLKRRVSLPPNEEQQQPPPFKKTKTEMMAILQPESKIQQDILNATSTGSASSYYKGSVDWSQNIYYGYTGKQWTDANGNTFYESLIGHMHMEPATAAGGDGNEAKHGFVSDVSQVLQLSGKELIPLKCIGTPLPPDKTRRKLMAELQRRSGQKRKTEMESSPAVKTEHDDSTVKTSNQTFPAAAKTEQGSAPVVKTDEKRVATDKVKICALTTHDGRTVKLSDLSLLLEMSARARDGTKLTQDEWHSFLYTWLPEIAS